MGGTRRSLVTPFGRVGSGEQHRWHFEAERLRGLEVERRELITPLGGAVAWRSPRKRSSAQNIAHRLGIGDQSTAVTDDRLVRSISDYLHWTNATSHSILASCGFGNGRVSC
jgi:hypothetical protein